MGCIPTTKNHWKTQRTKNKELKDISELVPIDFNNIVSRAEARAELLINIPSIAKAFSENNRAWLIEQLVPMFNEQKANYDVIAMQFHKAPATTFLKLHAPNNDYGEDLSDFRQTIVSVNTLKRSQKGLELGRAGIGLRGVVPIFPDFRSKKLKSHLNLGLFRKLGHYIF